MSDVLTNPVLTIVVPSYNVEAYLKRGLSTYCDLRLEGLLEVIIVNDGSTDRTREIADSFVERYPRIFNLVNKENGGHGSAVNAGIKAATGTYFRVVDGDDWVNTDNLVKLVCRLACVTSDLVVDTKREVDMSTGNAQHFPLPPHIREKKSYSFTEICVQEDIAPYIMIHTLMIRVDFLRNIDLKLLEKTFYVDLEYVVKATLEAETIEFVDLNVYQYMVGNANQSVADDGYVRRWEDHTRVTEEMLALYSDRSNTLDADRLDYLRRRIALLINTHYNIALIFDKDRKRGKARARKFHDYLKEYYPEFYSLTNKRYQLASALHYIGIDSQDKLNRFHG